VNRLVPTLLGVVFALPAAAQPDVSWSLTDPDPIAVVADFDGQAGLEAVTWSNPFSPGLESFRGFSFGDLSPLGATPDAFRPADSFPYALDVDAQTGAELLVLEDSQTQGTVRAGAYRLSGGLWTRLWFTDQDFLTDCTDLRTLNLGAPGQAPRHLLATGRYAAVHELGTGRLLWDSSDSAQGPGGSFFLQSVTVADFDGASAGDELLLEFRDVAGSQLTSLWLLDDTSVTAVGPVRATRIAMGPSRPNPSLGESSIRFELPQAAHTRLTVLDARGRRVRTLADRRLDAGAHVLTWDGRDDAGREAARGTYFFELQAEGQRQSRKLTVVR